MNPTILISVWLALLAPFQTPIVPVDPWNPPLVADCETITDLNPGGPTFDMLDWTTPDADIRASSHMASDEAGTPGAYVLGTIVTQDRITYLKTLAGDTWDVVLVDDVGLWSWRTEFAWNVPRSFTQFRRAGQILNAPRIGRGGYPGMRWINCDSAYAGHVDCASPTRYGHLGYVIHELYGPYDYDPGYGVVKGPILKLAYYYGCTTPSTDSCAAVELTWLHRRYGQFAWRLYERGGTPGVRSGREALATRVVAPGTPWVLTSAPPPVLYVVPGVIRQTFPCDEEIP